MIKSTDKLFFGFSLFFMTILMAIGGWWLYLMIHLDQILNHLDPLKLKKMLFWEGSAFISILFLLSLFFLILYVKNQLKTKALQDFFSSLTHELKTPLASMKLQAEVIENLVENKDHFSNDIKMLLSRLLKDASHLETQMDKIIALSGLEREAQLNIAPIDIATYIKSMALHFDKELKCELIKKSNSESPLILADEFALSLILRNLFENSRLHAKARHITIEILENESFVELYYRDGGIFLGDHKKLGQLFYKFNSQKGSGIGLYLCRKLMEKMGGEFNVMRKVTNNVEKNNESANAHEIFFHLRLLKEDLGQSTGQTHA